MLNKVKSIFINGTEHRLRGLMRLWTVIIFIILDIFIFKRIGTLLFKTEEEFWRSIEYAFIPDFVSFFRGTDEYARDKISEFKLGFFVFVCVIVSGVEYWLITTIF